MNKNSAALSDSAIPSIAGLRPQPRRMTAGETLFHRGDKAFGIFFLASGRLRMQRVTPDGGSVTLHVARAGELFAEASLFAERYHCDAAAETDCEVWLYPKDELTARLRDDPAGLWSFAAGLAGGLHGLRQRYELKQIRSAPERVLQFLRLRCDTAGSYRPDGPLKDLAAELGLSHEALYRTLATLETRGRVVRDGTRLRLVAQTTTVVAVPPAPTV
ncbi:MAG: Crp/Fnr family transcriptional regulator [Sulfuritalea sp.]|nr:Crp/Fnr family transcriptional regulator [Sulfuritalea sp.]MDP1982912.1 Crp/Fnr family transcriptional regulator [Sulfuritalea sp.]